MAQAIRIIYYQDDYGRENEPPEGASDFRHLGSKWQEAANKSAQEDCDLLLFLAADVTLSSGCVERMQTALAENDQLAGVSPVLSGRDGKRITWLGYAFDSQLRLCSLYEGIAVTNSLAGRPRRLQTGHPAAFMLRQKDFIQAGGLIPAFGKLSFFNLCLRLAALRNGYFTVAGTARYENRIAELERKGIWDSLIMRGKIQADSLQADYSGFARADGLVYGVNEWLAEGPRLDAGDSAWLCWRRNPSPQTLLSWLSGLTESELGDALAVCRQYPAILPAQFRYYEVLSKSQCEYAAAQGLKEMRDELGQWLGRARSFHYGGLRAGMRMLKKAGIYMASLDRCPAVYNAWLELSPNARPVRCEPASDWPQIAVAMPVYNPEPSFLRQALDSVLAQSYQNWKLCIADDASTLAGTRDLLEAYAMKDTRIRIIYRSGNGHISRATNSALELAQSPYVAFMDQDDMLAPDALAEVAKKLASANGIGLAYSDSDHIDASNIRRNPYFKHAFEPELQAPGHLSVYAAHLLHELGGLRIGYEGSQDYDLLLRAMEICERERIVHIPRILYHWRVHGGSTAATAKVKPYVFEATRKALSAALMRRGLKGRLTQTQMNNFYLPCYAYPEGLSGAVMIMRGHQPASSRLVEELIRLEKQFGLAIYFEDGSMAPDRIQKNWEKLAGGIRPESLARELRCEVTLVLYSCLEPAWSCQPEQALIQARNLENALVGGMFWLGQHLWHGGLYPDRSGKLFPLLRGIEYENLANFCWGEFVKTHEALAVSPLCFAIRRELLSGLPSFEPEELADFSLERLERGMRTLVSPWSQWQLTACAPKDPQINSGRFLARWGELAAKSGLRNPNLEAAPDNDWTLILPQV